MAVDLLVVLPLQLAEDGDQNPKSAVELGHDCHLSLGYKKTSLDKRRVFIA